MTIYYTLTPVKGYFIDDLGGLADDVEVVVTGHTSCILEEVMNKSL